MNKQNYARDWSYYCKQLHQLETFDSGAKEELKDKGLSVYRNTYKIGRSIDEVGEKNVHA